MADTSIPRSPSAKPTLPLSTHLEALRDHTVALSQLTEGTAAYDTELEAALATEATMSRFIGDIAHGQPLHLDHVLDNALRLPVSGIRRYEQWRR